MFLRKPARQRDPLPVTMAAVRMGERVLQIGACDEALAAVFAAKVGLSGHAVIVVSDTAGAERMNRACAEAGVLADVKTTPLDALAEPDGGFDVVIVHGSDQNFAQMDDARRTVAMRAGRQALREGGRLIVIESTPPSGLAALLSRSTVDAAPHDGHITPAILEAAGFRAVRVLAEREGFRFTEGMKRD